MRIDIITLFPELFQVLTHSGVTGRAFERGLYFLKAWNPRDFTEDVHHTVDDRPFGGGAGMVMMNQPLDLALQAIRQAHESLGLPKAKVLLLAPYGKVFEQKMAKTWSDAQEPMIFVCGRYEGIDERWIHTHVDEVISLGDFIVSGAEIALIPMLDAMVRLIPKAVNNADSIQEESFSPAISGLLDYPHYTRPEVYQGQTVPSVLLSGHHAKIKQWRREQSLLRTLTYRPDLIQKARKEGLLSPSDEQFLSSAQEISISF